jgi:hypothetical protein
MPSIKTTIRRNDESHLRVRPTLLGEHVKSENGMMLTPVLNKPFKARCGKTYAYDSQGCVHHLTF